MGKTEPTLGGKPKVPNEIKRKAASARTKGPIIVHQVDQPDQNGVCFLFNTTPFLDNHDCWSVALSRLLQAVYNMNLRDSKSFLEFMHKDLVHHLKKAELDKKVPSFSLSNIKKALSHIESEGILTVKASGHNTPGGPGRHEKWSFYLIENATPEFIKEKLDVTPVAISFHSSDNEFASLGNEIYLVRNLEVEGQKKLDSHMVLVVAYGYTAAGRIFFLLQNSWGLKWGVNGYGRIFIDQNSAVTVIFP
ncbi:unnamed protein product [Cochlearia groenlandica]